MKKSIVILFLGVVVLLASCEKTYISLKSKERRLTEKTWRVTSYVDHTLNACLDPSDTEYMFEEDGRFIVVTADTVNFYSTWELDNEEEYLTIGNNTFKLVLVTNKILSLRYGELDVFYVPAED